MGGRRGCLLALAGLLLLPGSRAGMLGSLMGSLVPPHAPLAGVGGALELEPTCVNTFLACSAACSELKAKAIHHAPLPYGVWPALAGALALAAAVALHAAGAARAALRDARADFAAREAALTMRVEGIKNQAYDLGRRAARGAGGSRPGSRASRPCSRQAGSRGASRVTSPAAGPPGGGVTSPASSAQGLSPAEQVSARARAAGRAPRLRARAGG